MKKVLSLCIMVFVAFLNVNAQMLTQQMFNLYYGHVKTLAVRVEGVFGESSAKFDRDGKVTEIIENGVQYKMQWNKECSSVLLRGYVNGSCQGEQTLSIYENSASTFSYGVAGITNTYNFKSNGAISKQTMSSNGQTQSCYYYYRSSEDIYPYKTVTTMNGQSMTTTIEILSVDSKGNPTRYSQSSNDHTMTRILEITYY